MDDPKLKVGDVVQLASGGPVMTVRRVIRNGSVRCDWSEGIHHKWEIFPAGTQFIKRKPWDLPPLPPLQEF